MNSSPAEFASVYYQFPDVKYRDHLPAAFYSHPSAQVMWKTIE